MILESERRALLRLGALVGNAPIQEVFDAISEELGRIIDTETGETFEDMAGLSRFDPDGMMTFISSFGPRPDWPSPIGSRWPLADGDSANARVYRTGKPARLEGGIPVTGSISRRLSTIKAISSIAVPIFVDDKLWGSATVVSDRPRRLPATTESRLLEFAALASTAISSAQRREQVERLADEQAALRRVATLVAAGAQPEQVWESVVSEVGVLCGASRTGLIRYVSADAIAVLALWADEGDHEEVAARWPMAGGSLSARVAAERTVVRIDDWSEVDGEIAATIRETMSVGASIMAPVFSDHELWGGLVVHSAAGESPADDTERRLVAFADLVSTAIAGAEARTQARRLADEQSAIRRVATLTARQAPVPVLCQAVADELHDLLEVEDVKVSRFDDGKVVIVGGRGLLDELYPAGFTSLILPDTAVGQVFRDHRPVRVDGYEQATSEVGRAVRGRGVRSTIALPILLGERLWGALSVSSLQPGRIPERVVQPISDCIDLIATAIRNAEAEESLRASRERIVTATDAARRRFERDLHDGAQQRLVALALELRAMPGLDGEELAATADEVDSILTDLRTLSRGLHPAVLSEGGLGTAIRSLARRCPTPVELTFPSDWPGADDMAELAFYYFVAESLTNVAKHALATRVTVDVVRDDESIRVTVADDGLGGADTADGSGLLGIADRMEALGGSLSVSSPPGAGTTLVATVPVRAGQE
ncbi:GAF domain-containing protein [Actinoplanes sp. Pm04-4]|uniref:histidine kinase n=1 Tax=Paractinoplanes pyxinae TaxID=2997416 RepID=A0ABT4ASB8_9ACTN|nr:GAF domain-containing protein [Actinoplanes pyxinae]MCY1137135.1 GAF domain-containing protein [Actinoplanes pyxinae]